jgi:hypothetical protein
LIGFPIRDVDRLSATSELLLGGFDASEPPGRLAEALIRRPFFVTNRLLQSEHGLDGEQAERRPRTISGECEREVPEEPLRRWLDQMSEPFALCLTAELKRRRVVHHDDPWCFTRSPCRLSKVRRQNRLWRHLLIAEKAIGTLQLRVVQCLGKTLAWSLRESLSQ